MGVLFGVGDFGLEDLLIAAQNAEQTAVTAKNQALAAAASTQEGKEKGFWNVATNSPALTASSAGAVDGEYYSVTVGGAIPFSGANFPSGFIVEAGARLAKLAGTNQWFIKPNLTKKRLAWTGNTPIAFDFTARTITIRNGFFVDETKAFYNQQTQVVVPMNTGSNADLAGITAFFVDVTNPNALQYYVARYTNFGSVPATAIPFAYWYNFDGQGLTYFDPRFYQEKITGKGLSTEDYTTAEKTKVVQSGTSFLTWAGTNEIAFDFTARTITVAGGFWMAGRDYFSPTLTKNGGLATESVVVPMPAANASAGINAFFADPVSKEYYVKRYADFGTVPSTAIPIATWYDASGNMISFPSGRFYTKNQIDNSLSTKANNSAKFAKTMPYNGYLSIDSVNRKVSTTGQVFVMVNGILSNVTTPQASTDWDSDTVVGLNYIMFNPSTLQFAVVKFDRTNNYPSTTWLLLGWVGRGSTAGFASVVADIDGRYMLDGIVYPVSPYTKTEVDVFARSANMEFVSQTATGIVFDFTAKTITIPDGYFCYRKAFLRQSGSKTLTMPATMSGINSLWVKFVTANAPDYWVVNYTEYTTVPDDAICIGYWYNATGNNLTYIDDKVRKVAGKGLSTEDFTTAHKNKLDGITAPFSETTHRLIMPPKIWGVTEVELPIYKSSMISENTGLDSVKTALVERNDSNNQLNQPRYTYFDTKLSIKPETLYPTASLLMTRTGAKNYIASSTFQKVTKASLNGKTANIHIIGDSLTNRGIPSLVKAILASWGANVTPVGTMANSAALGYAAQRGDGREGWEAENYTGADNNHSNGGAAIVVSYDNPSTINKNPFLKLATETDKANNPDWCFRNTGASAELSYTADPDKTGNFYIFDYANYLTATGISAPSVISIALSTNDILQDGKAEALVQVPFHLEIMIRQMKAALPNVKIGIVPIPAWGFGTNNWPVACEVAESIMTKVKSLQANITGLEIAGVWPHINRDFNFPYNAGTPLSSINDTSVVTLSDTVHWHVQGTLEYAYALACFYANMI